MYVCGIVCNDRNALGHALAREIIVAKHDVEDMIKENSDSTVIAVGCD